MEQTEAPPWVWQGFYGPIADAEASYAAVKTGHDVGVLVPPGGPRRVNKTGTHAMWAVQTRPDNPMPCPPGMEEATEDMVGRMIGA